MENQEAPIDLFRWFFFFFELVSLGLVGMMRWSDRFGAGAFPPKPATACFLKMLRGVSGMTSSI
jgi:hypothetical protein